MIKKSVIDPIRIGVGRRRKKGITKRVDEANCFTGTVKESVRSDRNFKENCVKAIPVRENAADPIFHPSAHSLPIAQKLQ